MRSHNRLHVLAVVGVIGVLAISQAIPSAQAQTTNITSSGLGTKITQAGNTYNIEGGARPGSSGLSTAPLPGPNVFHSFGRFDLGAGNIANFIRPDAAATTVISRVTGGVPSNINGTIQALGWSNFYFVNPSGVVFGPSATLNVSGSVYISTAHYMKFSDGGVFSTRPGTVGAELLSSSPVSSFGFLQGVSAAPITITGSKLSVGSGQTLSIVGGPITVDGAQLTAPNGKVQVASVGETTGRPPIVSYRTEEVLPSPPPSPPSECVSGCDFVFLSATTLDGPSTAQQPHTVINTHILGPGGEVSVNDVRSINNLTLGNITMNPGKSFASLDAGPNGTVQTIPAVTPSPESQIITQPNSSKPSLIKVVAAPVLNTLSPNLTIEEGQTTTVTISLNKPAEITEAVTLSNSNSSAATTVPAGPTITFNPGEQTKTVQVTGVKEGATQLRATLRNVALNTTINVVTRLAFSGTLTPTVELGQNGTLTITLNRTSSTPTDVTLSSLTPGVATLNTTKVTIPAGETSSVSIDVNSVNVGTATIRASLSGVTVDRSMQITPMSLVSLSGVSILEGQAGTAIVTLPRNAPSTVRVTLATSDSTIATVERSFVDIPANTNRASFTVRGVTEGTVQLRAQSGNSTQTAAVVVNALPPPPLSSLAPNLSLKIGSSGSIAVVLREAFQKNLTVLLKSSDPSIASVNEAVTIPANSTTSQPVVVTGNAAGRTTIIASLLNSSVQASVDVSSVAPVVTQSTANIAGASQTVGLAAAVQYPRALAAPQGSVTVPRLLADKCAAMKDGQFSSFAQLNRDSAPPQPGRYLSAPTLLEGDPITGARETVPEIYIMVGPPKVLTVHPDVVSFIALARDCRLEVK